MERGTNDMRSAAWIAEDIRERGGGATEILEALRTAADAIEHGWQGSRFMGYTAGPLEDDGLEDALCSLDDIRYLIEDRKTVSVKDLKEALGES